MEGVDQPLPLGILIATQKMPRHTNAHHRKAESAGHELIKATQRNRDAPPTVDHPVQVAILRIKEVLCIAPETLFPEEHRIECGNYPTSV